MSTSADEKGELPTLRNRLQPAIEALRSLRDGDRGVAEAIACGKEAIPILRELLFEREPSGLFESRRRAVETLAALGARDVLIEFLESSPDIADPVERLGQDAVMNAAARSLRELRDPRALQLFLSLVRRRPLSGAVAALGGFQAPETIPYFIDALAEDECRPEAEVALRKMASRTHDALIVAALQDPTRQDRESESRLRQRRSALALLVQTGVRSNEWAALRNIMEDQDPKLVVLACRLCLACAPELEKQEAIDRLRRLLPSAALPLRFDIEQCLAQHAGCEGER